MTDVGLINVPSISHGAELDQPQVAGASAVAYNKVRVTFNQEVKKSSPTDPADALNPSNYAFTGGFTATGVTLIIGGPTVVEVTLDTEMQQGAAYEVEVSNVTNLYGQIIDPDFDTAAFTGVGVAPEVSGAAAQDEFTVSVTFNEDMKNNAALTTATNYSFSGGLIAASVVRISATVVDVTVNEMLQGGSYQVTVSNVEDLAGNTIAGPPDNQASFTGIGVAPQVLAAAIPVFGDPQSVYIDYTETVQVADATDAANYGIAPSLGALTITQVTATRYKVTFTLSATSGTLYTITVSNVRDIAGNTIDTANDQAAWTAVVPSPPLLDFFPGDQVTNIDPKDYLRVQAIDSAETFSGIDTSTWNIWIIGTRLDGTTFTADVLVNGVVQPGYEVSFIGDANDPVDGIYARFRPVGGAWTQNLELVVYAQVSDNDATSSSDQWTCYFGEYTCFESNPPTPGTLENTLISGIPNFPGTDQLRGILMRACTQSKVQQIQARTLLWFSTATDLRTILARVFDLTLTDVTLCDTQSLLSIQAVILRNGPVMQRAVSEMDALVGRRTLQPVLDYLMSESPLHVVSAACALVVLGATAGSS